VLERALDRGVDRVQPVERERLRRTESPTRQRLGAVVGEDAVRDRVQLRLREAVKRPRPLGNELLTEGQMADQRAGVAQCDLGAELELARLADVVEDRRA
jgi:hypothetical protein